MTQWKVMLAQSNVTEEAYPAARSCSCTFFSRLIRAPSSHARLWFISRSSDWQQRPKLVECNPDIVPLAISVFLMYRIDAPTHLSCSYIPEAAQNKLNEGVKCCLLIFSVLLFNFLFLHLPDCYFNWTWSSRPRLYVLGAATVEYAIGSFIFEIGISEYL